MNFLEKNIIKPRKKERKANSPNKPDRRKFLKGALSSLLVAGMGTSAFAISEYFNDAEEIEEYLKKLREKESEELENIKEKDESEVQSVIEGQIQKREEYLKANAQSKTEAKSKADKKEIKQKTKQEKHKDLNQLILYAENDIILDSHQLQKDLFKKWKKNYGEGGKMHRDLVSAYSKMQVYIDDLKKEFAKQGVPEEFAYLAIPESHFMLHSKSKKSAVGPYQFTLKTAEMYGLAKTRKNKNGKRIVVWDNREDPIQSARAAAKFLKELYDVFGSWDLALSAYNGGFAWGYKKNSAKGKRTYDGFVQYIEDVLNRKKQEFAQRNFLVYKVKKGNTVSLLARKFHLDQEDLKQDNNIGDDNQIQVGQKLKIRITANNKEFLFKKYANTSGFIENLNYPAKFKAVLALIQEAESQAQNPLFNEKIYAKAKIDKERKEYYTYTIKRGDTLFGLSRQWIKKRNLKISTSKLVQEIKKINNLSSDNLKPKQKIKIPYWV